MNKALSLLLCFFGFLLTLTAQDRWQQHAEYNMVIDFDVETHQYSGKQTIIYTNNSPDELTKLFYHLYFNAFQPGINDGCTIS